VSLRPRTLYRMDTVLSENTTSFQWPTDVLSNVGLSAGDYGVLGMISYSTMRATERAYIPLRVMKTKDSSSNKKYQVYVYSLAQLTEVYLTLASAKSDGSTDKYIVGDDRSGRPLRKGPYLAESKIQVPLPNLAHGLYNVTIGGYERSGNPVALKFQLYVP